MVVAQKAICVFYGYFATEFTHFATFVFVKNMKIQ